MKPSDVAAREARLLERETALEVERAALEEQKQALEHLQEAMSMLKQEVDAQLTAPEVARTPRKRPRQRGRRLLWVVSVSPRRRSPAKSRRNKLMVAPTAIAGSAGGSPHRRGRRSFESCSTTASMEEPPPKPSSDLAVTGCEASDGGLLNSFPVPLGMSSWDWPLSRDEKKALVIMFDRQELMVQRDDYAEQLQQMKMQAKQLVHEL